MKVIPRNNPFSKLLMTRKNRIRIVPHRYLPGLILVALFSLPGLASAQPVKFNSPVTYPAGSPFVVSSGDFNGDGRVDLVAGDLTNSDLILLLGKGDGTLQAPITFDTSAPPRFLVTSDLNRDGRLDLVFSDTSPAHITVLLGKGDGSFHAPTSYPVNGWQVIAADFNNDGKPDLAARANNSSINVLLNKGDGTFQGPQNLAVPTTMLRVVAAADFNGDGRIDLGAVGRNSNGDGFRIVSLLLGNGDGTFQPPVNTSGNWGGGTGPYSVAVGDVDRDGRMDIVASDERLMVLKNNGDGTFKPPTSQPQLNNTSADLEISDFNGDGKPDLVSSGVFATGALQVLLGVGDGTFQNLGDMITGRSSVSVVVSDLNGDTRPDLAANMDGQLAVALVNATPGDLNNTDYFVHQHYLDFLDREPDAGGFDFWARQIADCGVDQQCREVRRINTSAAFYLSIEFQETAYLVERLYKVSYGDAIGTSTIGGTHPLAVPIVRLNQFLIDTEQINAGVVVLQPNWPTILENNKQAFLTQWVQRPQFTTAFPTSMTAAEFVQKLDQNAGNVLSSTERANAIALFGSAADTNNLAARALAVRGVAENQRLYAAEFNRAFVLTQYFGYLRRNPDDAPEQTRDYSGYDFWLTKLNSFNGNPIAAEMVKAFITSTEYERRFSQ